MYQRFQVAALVCFGILVAHSSVVGEERTLEILDKKEFGSDTLVRSANHLIEIGETDAVELLTSSAIDPIRDISSHFDVNERIGWLCRLVFLPNDGVALRPPAFGGLYLPVDSIPLKSWPKYPLVVSNDVVFVLSEGYIVAGEPEGVPSYLRYCRQHGYFRERPLPIPTREKAKADLEDLLKSTRWKDIKWSYKDADTSYHYNENGVIRFLNAQVDSTAP